MRRPRGWLRPRRLPVLRRCGRCPAAACTDALADAAADGVGQLTAQHCLVEGQGAAVVTACHGQLPVHALGADADAHAAQLVAALQGLVPEQQVAVQVPVVVVGGAAVVGLAALQGSTDLHQEGGAVLLYKSVLALLRGQVRVLVLQLLGSDKGHVGGVKGQILQLGGTWRADSSQWRRQPTRWSAPHSSGRSRCGPPRG